jgi:hypothetical protein
MREADEVQARTLRKHAALNLKDYNPSAGGMGPPVL